MDAFGQYLSVLAAGLGPKYRVPFVEGGHEIGHIKMMLARGPALLEGL